MRVRESESGVSLIETMIAILVAFIAMASVGAVVFNAMVSNKNQGTEIARMTSMAQEKIEELNRLPYDDATTNTTLISDTNWNVGLTPNTGTDLDYISGCPSTSTNIGYVDFLDANGLALSGGTCAAAIANGYSYERRWRTTTVTGVTGLKQITVVVYAPNAVRTGAQMPVVTLTTLKSQ
jgi:hypothetical protein